MEEEQSWCSLKKTGQSNKDVSVDKAISPQFGKRLKESVQEKR